MDLDVLIILILLSIVVGICMYIAHRYIDYNDHPKSGGFELSNDAKIKQLKVDIGQKKSVRRLLADQNRNEEVAQTDAEIKSLEMEIDKLNNAERNKSSNMNKIKQLDVNIRQKGLERRLLAEQNRNEEVAQRDADIKSLEMERDRLKSGL